MGKFKEQAIQRVDPEHARQQECNLLVVQYPMLTMFIREAFATGQESKIYDLLFSLEMEATC